MFGRLWKRRGTGPGGGGARAGRGDSEPDAGEQGAAGPARKLATYDKLGETMVSTIITAALSGHDAAELVSELYVHIRDANAVRGTAAPVRHVVFDLQNVQYMDSTCIGTLVELLGRLQEAGGRIAIVNAAQNVEYLFKLTRLDRVFPLCRDVMRAIEVVERAAAA